MKTTTGKTTNLRRFLASTTVLSVIGLLAAARAGTLASEDFGSYPTENIDGRNGGSGWSGGWRVGAPSFGYLNMVRNNEFKLSYPNYVTPDGGNYANLASGYDGPGFNYIQRAVDLGGAFAAYATTNTGGYGVVGADHTTLWGSFLYYNVAGLQLWLQQQTGQSSTINMPFAMPTLGSNSLFLFRIEFGAGEADTITIWSNPELATWTPAASPTLSSVGDYSFRNFIFVAPNDKNEGRIDNIRLGSQALDVVPHTPPAAGYTAWAISNGLEPLTDGAPDFDKDNDGWNNLAEYAFFTNPDDGTTIPALNVGYDGSTLTLTYLRAKAATDVNYTAEWSTDLVSWSGTGLADLPTGTENSDVKEFRATVATGTDLAKILRVRVSLTATP